MKYWTIYCHTHTESGRRYIGLTSRTMERRWSQHVVQSRSVKGNRSHFANAIRKYGKEAFTHEVLAMSRDLDGANATEEALIEQWGTRNPLNGFNLSKGGLHIPHPIRRNPWDDPEFRKKAVEASRRRAADPAWRAKISAIRVGVRLSPEHCSAISKSRMGKDHAPEVRVRINGLMKEIYKRPEIRAKNAKSSKRLWSDPEYREKVITTTSEALRKKWSIETPPRRAETDTHKICQKHGMILKEDCFKRIRAGRIRFECRECYRIRNNVAYHKRRFESIHTS